jgi:hypothetical protein
MVGGVVKSGKCSREIKLEYSYDRLSSEKIMQAYRLLVPEKIRGLVYAGDSLGEKLGGTIDEAGSDLCAGVFGPAKRGTYDW